ncbi:MAG: LD-carboxypeptidase [Breznakibacter sp.]
MIFPSSINKGSTIGLVSPAGKIDPGLADKLVRLLESKGYRCRFSPNALGAYHQFSATDGQRLSDLQQLLDDEEVDAILCLRGGYGAIRLLGELDLNNVQKKPKWLVGFSDITVLHALLQGHGGMVSLHGPMAKHIVEAENNRADIGAFWQFLEGDWPEYVFPTHSMNRLGNATGRLVGGNLSLLYALRGTPYDIVSEGDVLFVEDLNEYLYHLDRMMRNLKLGGILARLSALVVGQFTDMKDNATPFGASAYEIVYDAVKEYGYPVIFGFPAGHSEPNYPLPLGANVSIGVMHDQTRLIFHHG